MKVGIDISNRSISAALLSDNNIMNFIEEPICDSKRNGSRVIMEKIISLIHRSVECRIKGIGLSLPSRIDKTRGIVFDLMKIPYWKSYGIKKILEDEFNTQVWVNNDANCLMIAEKSYGMCKGFKNILCINIDCNVGISIAINGNIFVGNRYSFNQAKCPSIPCYDCIRIYKESFMRTIEDLMYICSKAEKDPNYLSQQDTMNEVGTLIGRLISIFLCNYNLEVVVLGGSLGRLYTKYADAMDDYLKKNIDLHTFLNLVIFSSTIKYSQALGATSLISPIAMYSNII